METIKESKLKVYSFYSSMRGTTIEVEAVSKQQALYFIRQEIIRKIGCYDNNLNGNNIKLGG